MSKRRSGNPAKAAGPTYWHGGTPGLRPGDVLVPGRGTTANLVGYQQVEVDYDQSRVYVTVDRRLARGFAMTVGGGVLGSVYRVRPVGPVENDPDYAPEDAVCFTCDSAVVLAVVETQVVPTEDEWAKAGAPYTRWDNGTLMYDADGFFTMAPHLEQFGLTEDLVRSVGPWRGVEALTALAASLKKGT